jgi:aminotransferase
MSKTYSVTGWRVGYIIAPAEITASIRKMHDFMTVGAPAPLQEAGAVALRLPDSYYAELAQHYLVRRDRLLRVLQATGFNPIVPKGAYYIMCDIGSWGFPNDVEFARFLVKDVGVAAVPGSSFFRNPAAGKDLIRFTFCKREETIAAAEERLQKVQTKQISRVFVQQSAVKD